MAKAFNLTAQLNLQGPLNIKPIVSKIKKEIGSIKADLKLNIDQDAVKKVASITRGIENLSRAALKATSSVSSLNAGLTSLGSSLGSIKAVSGAVENGINKVSRSSTSSAKAAKQAATEIQAFGDAAGLALKRFAAFSTVSTVIYGLVNSINDAISEFIIYDRELVRLSQVTGDNIGQFGILSEGIQNISDEVRRLSTSLGVSSQDLITVASTLAQAGLSADETKIALEALAKSALAPSFDDITQTVEGSIAALRQFGLGVGDLESALGSINKVAADFAVESDDIIKAIQRTGGVFASASRGVSGGTDALNEFIAVFTSIRATTRESAETIATGLRTIFTRIQRTDTVDALKELGVELRDSQGKFIGAFNAVEQLSKGLSSLDPRSETFAEIVEELGGFRQIGKVIPLIQQFDTAQAALASAQQGSTSLTEASVKALFSLENQLSRTREEFLALVSEFAQSSTIKALTVSTLGLTRGFLNVVGALKPLLPLITTLATIKIAQKIPEFIGGGGRIGFLSGLFKGAAPTGEVAGNIATNTGTNRTGTTIGGSSPILFDNTTAIKNLTISINNLSSIISSRPGRTGFATGGLVGGVGNRDTVPAMLTPGEFVIRKKAVESIGIGNLDRINKYAGGGRVKDLIDQSPRSKTSKSLAQKYDTDGPFDTYDAPNISRSRVVQPNTQNVVNRQQTRAVAKKWLSQAREIYRTDGLDAANKFLSQRTQKMVAKLPEDHFDRNTEEPINKIQGAIAEKKVRQNFRQTKTQSTKLPYTAGADFAIDNGKSFVEVKNRRDLVPDNELIIKSLLAYAYTNGQQQIITDPSTNKSSKVKGFRDGRFTKIPSLDIQLYSTNPDDIIQEKNLGGKIVNQAHPKLIREVQQFKFGGSPKDTVPALLTPGEFVIRKEAAQKLGSATLHKMNYADKLQGYNQGGFVGGSIVQKFADGAFVPEPLTRTGSGDIEAYVQKIIIALEKAAQAAEKQAYASARSASVTEEEARKRAKVAGELAQKGARKAIFKRETEKGTPEAEAKRLAKAGAEKSKIDTERQVYRQIIRDPATTAIEAVKLAKEAGIEAARKEASRITSAVTERGGATQYKEKDEIENAKKRMVEAIKSGKDPSIKGKTELRRTPGYFDRAVPEIPEKPAVAAEKEISESAKETSEALDTVSDRANNFDQKLTNIMLVLSNVAIPQLKSFADSLKATDNAFGSAGVQALELGASMALSSSFALQAVGANSKTIKAATIAGGAAGIIGGGLQGFAGKNIENAIKDNSKALSEFGKSVQQIREAPTEKLRVEAASELENQLSKLSISTQETVASIEANEFWDRLGGAVNSSASTFLALNTSLLAFQSSITKSTIATETRAAVTASASAATAGAATAAGAAGAAASAGGFMRVLGTAASLFAKFNLALQVGVFAISVLPNVFNLLFSTTGRTIEQISKFGNALRDSVKNSNNYSLANQRFTTVVIDNYRKIEQNIKDLPEAERAIRERDIFGGVTRVTEQGIPTGEFADLPIASRLNEFNLALDQFVRDRLRQSSLIVPAEQSIAEFGRSLKAGSASSKEFNRIIRDLKPDASGVSEFDRIMAQTALMDRSSQTGEQLNSEQAAARLAQMSSDEIVNLSRNFQASISKIDIQSRSTALGFRLLQIESLNMIDILNRVNSGLNRISKDSINSFDDALNNFRRLSDGNIQDRADTSAGRAAEVLRNLPAFNTQEITDAMNIAISNLGLIDTGAVLTDFLPDGSKLSEYADKLQKNVAALQIAQKEIPVVLRDFASTQQAGDTTEGLRVTLRQILEPIQLDAQTSGVLVDELLATVKSSKTGEATVDFDKLIGSSEALLKNLDVFKLSAETSAKVLDLVNEKNQKLAEVTNALISSMQKVTQLEIQTAQLGLETSLEINKILGKDTGLQDLNKPFNVAINRLTRSIGSQNPQDIADAILRNNKILATTLAAPSNQEEINNRTKLIDETNNLTQALNMLGEKNVRLTNAVDQLRIAEEKRQGIGTFIERALKTSIDPIARGQLTSDINTFLNVESGASTNVRDLLKVLEFIDSGALKGFRTPEQISNVRTRIQQTPLEATRQANLEEIARLEQAGQPQQAEALRTENIRIQQILDTLAGKFENEIQAIDTALQTANDAINGQIRIQLEAQKNLSLQTNTTLEQFRNNLRAVWPQIIAEMEAFKVALQKINSEKNTNIPAGTVSLVDINAANVVAAQAIKSISAPLTGQPAVGAQYDIPESAQPFFSERKRTTSEFFFSREPSRIPELLPNIATETNKDVAVATAKTLYETLLAQQSKYGDIKTSSGSMFSRDAEKSLVLLEQVLQKSVALSETSQPAPQPTTKTTSLSPFGSNISVGTDTLTVRQPIRASLGPSAEATARQRAEAAALGELAKRSGGTYTDVGLKPQQPSTVITDANGRKFLEVIYAIPEAIKSSIQQPVIQPTLPPAVGGGQFMVPPEAVRPTAQATGITNTPSTKLDFDYNDFITKFSRAFDTQTGKFRQVITDLSLAFPALNAPIDKFSSSVTKLIDGLNAINDAGGIKGPNIPEKVNLEVVFNEDLIIDTSRINNNDLLNQIAVVTTEAVERKFKELKLTGQI